MTEKYFDNMELLFSNIMPCKVRQARRFSDFFMQRLAEAETLRIAVGYVSVDSLMTLRKAIEDNNNLPHVELMLGMHHFDGITERQYQALKYLDDFLTEHSAGFTSISTACKFHGKLYSFCKNNLPFAAIVGSSNLDGILPFHLEYEADVAIYEKIAVNSIDEFIRDITSRSAELFKKWKPKIKKEDNLLLQGLDGVEKVEEPELKTILSKRSNLIFKIPLKASEKHQKSNLNIYFGEGRRDKRGLVKPRHWYEAELIVPKEVTSMRGYPSPNGAFTVYTDDGWKFECKVSGDYGKNLRSSKDLQTLRLTCIIPFQY